MNCIIIEDVELTIVIRVISDYIKYFRKKSRSFHKKSEKWERTEDRKKTVQTTLIHVMTINEKILLFSGRLSVCAKANKVVIESNINNNVFRINTCLRYGREPN